MKTHNFTIAAVLFLFFIRFVTINTIVAQTWKTPMEVANTGYITKSVTDGFFINDNEGWLSCADGIILHSTDGGASWRSQTSGVTELLQGIYFTSSTQGWAVGANGTILTTSNGGSTWSAQTSNTTRQLNSVHFTSGTQGWAVGATGTILTTSNGGSTWAVQTSNTSVQLNGVHFASSTQGWAVGATGTILTTSNGGSTWAAQTSGTTRDLYSVRAVSGTVAWTMGGFSTILKTTNGGTAWTSQSPETNFDGFRAFFRSATKGWALGATGRIYTTNDGSTWVKLCNRSTSTFFDIYFVTDLIGWAVGSEGVIYKSIDGGVNWIEQTSGTTNLLNAVYFINTSQGWAVGRSGTIVSTNNGGTTWTLQTSNTTEDLNDVYFTSANNGWIAGNSSDLLRTTNGGSTWTTQSSGTSHIFYKIGFTSANDGWASGSTGAVITSNDGGNTWVTRPTGSTVHFFGGDFLNSTRGWVGGSYLSNGIIYTTSDGGATWGSLYTGFTQIVARLQFVNNNEGWGLCSDDFIIKTTNGGNNWAIDLSPSFSVRGFFFRSNSKGWAVGQDGSVYLYTSTSTGCSQVATATETMTWTGSVSTDWANPCNWSPNGVPSATNAVTIPAATNDPIILSGSMVAKHIQITGSGASLTVNNGASLTVSSTEGALTLVNNGLLTNRGTINATNSNPNFVSTYALSLGSNTTFDNYGTLNLTSSQNTGLEVGNGSTVHNYTGGLISIAARGGIRGEGPFINDSGATISISGTNSAIQYNGSVSNSGLIEATGQLEANSGAQINNNACGTIKLTADYFNGLLATTINNGFILIGGTLHSPSGGTFTNNAVLKYGALNVSSILTNSGNASIVVNNTPTPIFTYGGTYNGTGSSTVNGIFTNSTATASAGTFTAPNTFVPDVSLPAGSQTLYAKITPSGGACFYVVPFTYNNTSPEMNVKGNGAGINDNDSSPGTADNTDFGAQLVASGTVVRTFTIENTGSGALNLSGSPLVSIGGTNAGDFTVTQLPTTPVAATNGTTTFQITFDPSASGLRTATVSIANNDNDENPYNFSIQGTGTDPEINLLGNGVSIANDPTNSNTPSTGNDTDFGSADITGGVVEKTFTIQNLGTGDLTLTGIAPNFISVNNSPTFTILTQPSASIIPPNGSATFVVRFDPSAVATSLATVTIANSDADESPYRFRIQGRGISSEINVKANLTDIANGDNTPSTSDGTDFGSADILNGSRGRGFTIENGGQVSLSLTGNPNLVNITGLHAADFTITSVPTTPINGSSSTGFFILFNPTAAGLRTATVSIPNTDVNENPYTFAIQGTGTTAPGLVVIGNDNNINPNDVTPSTSDNTNFGSANVTGGTITKTFTIENYGSSDLILNSPMVSLGGTHAADFSVTAMPASPIAAQATTTFEVTFDPSATGTRSATLTIASNDPNNPAYTFAIQGTGAAPADYTITTTGNNVVITDVTGTGETLNISENGSNIRFNVTGKTYSIDAGTTTAFTTPAEVPLLNKTGITINAAVGNDVINVGAFLTQLPTLTINGGTGDDQVRMNGDITFAANANLDLDLQNDDVNPGTDQVSFTNNAHLVLSGTGAAVIKVSRNIAFGNGTASLETVNGNLTLEANQQATAGTGDFAGISMSGAIVRVNGTGTLTVKGRSGTHSVTNQFGVLVQNGGLISGGTSATATIQGSVGAASADGNVGVYVTGTNARITSLGGNVSVVGLGGSTGAGSTCMGVSVVTNASITAGGSGTVTVSGTGGAGSGNFNAGVYLAGAAPTSITSSGGNVSVTGTGGGTGSGIHNYGIWMELGGQITAGGSGSVTVQGTGGTTIGNNNYGILIDDANTQITSGGGNVSVTGQGGGSGVSTQNFGVFVQNAAKITAGSTGTVSVNGTGGDATGGSNHGVYVTTNSAQITSSGGNVSVTGQGGGTSSGENNIGVFVLGSGSISSGGTGVVTVNGTGAGTSGNNNYGVYVFNANSRIGSTNANINITAQGGGSGTSVANQGLAIVDGAQVIAGGSGNVTIQANGGAGTGGGSNVGLYMQNIGTLVSSSGGNVTINAVGGGTGTGTNNYGVNMITNAQISAGGNGTVSVTGQGGGGTGSGNIGVRMLNTGTQITSSGGNITVTGIEGNGSSGIGISQTLSAAITAATNGGNITLIANSMDLGGTVSTQAPGSTTLRQYTNNVPINLGTSSNTVGGPLGLSDAELDQVTTGTLLFGNSNSGNLTVSADITRPAGTNVQLVSGGDVLMSGGGFNTGGGTLLLDPGTSPKAVKPTFNGTDVTATTLSFAGDLSIALNGTTAGDGTGSTYSQLKVAGAVNLTGVNLLFEGSYVPVGGETFTLIDNDGSDAVTGTFTGLAEGATLSNFRGSGLNATLSYVGGSGNNDVVIVIAVNNTNPTIMAAAAVTRQQSTPGSSVTIATVNDSETPAGSLTVTATTLPADITVTNITNVGGTVTATVAAGCFAEIGNNTVVLTVIDANGGTATANFTVNVTANTPPTLTYNNAFFSPGAGGTILPATGPVDNGATQVFLQSVSPSPSPAIITVNNLTGAVSVPNTIPSGIYTITVVASDVCTTATVVPITLSVQPVDYTITTTGGNVVITDVTGTGETLAVSESGSNIRFNVTGKTYSIDGAAAQSFNVTPADVPLSGKTGITINTTNGNDIINVGAFMAILPSLTINGGTGDDQVFMNGDITFAVNANLDLDLQNDDATPGTDAVTFASGANLVLSGTGTATVKVSKNATFNTGSTLITVNGNLTVEANQQASPTSGNFIGVLITGTNTQLQTTPNGTLTVKGRGGDDASGNQQGVKLVAGGKILGGEGANAVTVVGTGGASAGSHNYGVWLTDLNSRIFSLGGPVSVTGTGGGSGTSGTNVGVRVINSGEITSAGGNVTVVGQGGSNATGNSNVGISVQASGKITSNDTGGNVTITGTGGGSGASALNSGIFLADGELSAGGSGTVDITGQGGPGTGTSNDGLFLEGLVTSKGGSITLTGKPGGGSSLTYGIYMSKQMSAPVSSILTNVHGGNISIITNSLRIVDSPEIRTNAAGSVTIKPFTPGKEISIFGGFDGVSDPLMLSDLELDIITTGTLIIGDATSGDITSSMGITRPAVTNMQFVSGGDVVISGGNINTNGGTLLLDPGTSPKAVKPAFNGTDVTATTLSFAGDLSISLNGATPGDGTGSTYSQLKVAGAVNLTGVALLFEGSYVPVGGETFILIDNDGSDAVTGTFTGLAEGATLSNFRGSGLNATISYAGGSDNNDVVITVASPSVADINIQGNGFDIANGDSSPRTADGTDFGNIDISLTEPVVRTFTIQNTGTADLIIPVNGITKSGGADFGIGNVSLPLTIAPGGSATFPVIIDASGNGFRTATISIQSNDPDESPYTFNVQAIGVSPEINITGLGQNIPDGDVTPSALDDTDFGMLDVASGSVSHTFTIQNVTGATGNLQLNAGAISITGTHAGDFTVSAITLPATISAGQSTTFVVTFNPSALGLRTATVRVMNNDLGESTYDFTVQGYGGRPFITTWKTDNTGTSSSTSITIPTTGTGYNYDVDWNNDGIYDEFGKTGNATHNYGTAGTYTVAIRGNFPRIYFNNAGATDKLKILTVTQWGDIAWTSMASAFYGCSNLSLTATDVPNLAGVTDMSYMFANCSAFNQALPEGFNTANVTDMSSMFASCSAYNQALPSSFNTANVTDMSSMFASCNAYNQALPSSFNTAKVTDMSNMFFGCSTFNQALPETFNTTAVTNMIGMFHNCNAYNQVLPSSFNTANVTDMRNMFNSCTAFNQVFPVGFNTANVTNMRNMFSDCIAFNQAFPVGFTTANVTDMSNMFNGATAFNQNLGAWNIGAATNMTDMLNNSGLSVDNYDATLIGWNTGGYTNKDLGDASPLMYCAAQSARNNLIDNKGWSISGDTYTPVCLSADYTITTTGNNVVITDVTGTGETLDISENSGNIRFNVTGKTYSIDGGITTAFTTPADVALSGKTSITVNTAVGNDIINVGAFTTQLPTLTLNGGTGDDQVFMNGDITFAANANLDLDLQNDDANPGTDVITVNTDANLSFSGTGAVTLKASKTIETKSGSSLSATGGNILLEANQQVTPTVGSFTGIGHRGTISIIGGSAGVGTITLKGKGGDGTDNPQVGVLIAGNVTGLAGSLTIEGVGGRSAANGNVGIHVNAPVSSKSLITLIGTGNGTGASTDNAGVLITNTITNSPNTTKSVLITGTGANTTGTGNHGISLNNDITNGNGGIILTGTAGNTASDDLFINSGTIRSSSNPNNFTAINLVGDRVTINAAAVVGVNTGSDVSLLPRTDNTPINLGTETAGSLSYTNDELNRIFAYELYIGNATSGDLTISAPIAPANIAPTCRITLQSQNNLFISGGGITTLGGNVRLRATQIYPNFPGTDVSMGTGLVATGTNNVLAFVINGPAVNTGYTQLHVAGKVSLFQTQFTVTGSYIPTLGETFMIINNAGMDPIDHVFIGYTEGDLINNFLGSGLKAKITYVGGDGNDVVLTVVSEPIISDSPDNQTVCAGNATTFSVVSGNAVSYKWQSRSNNVNPWADLSETSIYANVTTPTLTISDVTGLNNRQYRCILTNETGNTNSEVGILTVTPRPSAAISYSGSPFAQNTGPVNVNRTGTAGGSYSASPTGLTIDSQTGQITPIGSLINDYTVTYTIAASGACAEFTTTANVSIVAAPAADYTITTTGGNVVITDVTGTGETLDISENSGNIRFNVTGKTYSIDGGITTAFTTPAEVPLLNKTSITVNTAVGSDVIHVGAFSTQLPTLTLNGGTGDDQVFMNGDITFAANANLDLDLQNDDANPGMDAVTFAINANLLLSGTGTAMVKVSKNITVNTGGSLVTQNGNVSLITDSIDIQSGATVSTNAANSVTLRPYTNGVGIDLGVATNPLGGPLSLSDGELDRITTGTLQIGDANSGAITVSTAISRATNTAMNLTSGGAVNFNASSLDLNGGNLSLHAAGGINPTATGADATVGTVAFTAGNDLNIVINGTTVDTDYRQLNVAGSINLTGLDLILSGSHIPMGGQTFTIVNNDGSSDAITGTFNGLAQGATISNFMSSGLNATVSYTGGDGNDVVITVNCPAFAAPTASVTAQPTCTTPTGTIVITAPTGGDIQYSVNGSDYQPSATFSDLAPATYLVTAKNTTTGCISEALRLVVNTVPGAPTLTEVTLTQPTCAVSTGTAVVNATGSGTLEYSKDGMNWQTNPDFTGLVPANYTFSVRLQSSPTCVAQSIPQTINNAPVPPSATIHYPNSPYSAIGTASVTFTGTAGGTFSSTTGLVINAGSGEVDLSASTPGTYTVTYTIAATESCPMFQTTASIQIIALNPVTVIFVNAANTNSIQDGSSWLKAFASLQSGLSAAASLSGSQVQVWVAQGTYKPGTLRRDVFTIPSGVKVFGGFVGTETLLSERNWKNHPTILSGEIGSAARNDNAQHVVLFSNTNDATALDGFSITRGYADFVENNQNTDPNQADLRASGAGILAINHSLGSIEHCTVYDNRAIGGAGAYLQDSSHLHISQSIFWGNEATFGGGIYANDGSQPRLENVLLVINKGLGGALYANSAQPSLINCTIAANNGGGNPGGIYNTNSTTTVKNSILWGNTAPQSTAGSVISYSIIEGGFAGVGNKSQNPLFVNPNSNGLAPLGSLGDYHLQPCSPAIDGGDNAGAPTADLEGNARPYPVGIGIVDMGVYESASAGSTGPANLTVNENITSGTVLKTGGRIVATNQVSNATVVYEATQSVTLQPGFTATPSEGKSFLATIGGCQTTTPTEAKDASQK